VVRTDLGREIIKGMLADGVIISRPGDSDPDAIKLMRRLSIVSRRRWPDNAWAPVKLGTPPPKKKAEPAAAATEPPVADS
jgi:coenzyme F420 hydrogenase subunit beta